MRQPFKTEETEEFSIAVKYRRLLGLHETVGLGSNRVDDGDRRLSFDYSRLEFRHRNFPCRNGHSVHQLASASIGTGESS